ncbi:tail protein [Lactococcus phage 50102]|uniref:Neck passage structure n=1 Tax=Lactococcus phage 50102 TaxID=2024336 RepID=A0A2Z2RSS5_9CAUD|nr:tail protein [Lactococcus phage 50102]ASZ70864.1 neck passage structure [Lactococcus phage 50102]
MINENTLNFIRFSSGFNNLKKEELETFAENEIFELNEYNASEEKQRKHFYTLLQSTDGTEGVEQEDGKYTHTAWSYSSDGTEGFTTVYPNLNLIDGSKDFSGDWTNSGVWINDGTYKGLTVKKRTRQWNGIYKTFTAPKDGTYTFSAYVKSSGSAANTYRYVYINGKNVSNIIPNKLMGNDFDWLRDSFTVTLKAKDIVYVKYEITGSGSDSILWTAGHKWEEGSTATPYMPSANEVTPADYPRYIGQYTDYTLEDSINPSSYTWREIKGKYYYTLEDVNTNGTLKSYIIECLKLSLQTRWGNNLEYHIDRKTKYLNKLTGMQA